MFDIKTLFLVISLVIITIFRHAETDKTPQELECEELIGPWFFDGIDEGVLNFQKSFAYLSLDEINEYFEIKENHTLDEKKIRVLTREINKSYFLHLFEGHQINFTSVMYRNIWCYHHYVSEYSDCKKSIEVVFGIDKYTDSDKTFEIMYTDWYTAKVEKKFNYYQNLPEKNFKKWPRNYPSQFFSYYAKKTYNVNGSFDSFEEFCEKKGKNIVLDKENIFAKNDL